MTTNRIEQLQRALNLLGDDPEHLLYAKSILQRELDSELTAQTLYSDEEQAGSHLYSNHDRDYVCRDVNCIEAIKMNHETQRFFITMGHCGFNSPTNNRRGYLNYQSARNAYRAYFKRSN